MNTFTLFDVFKLSVFGSILLWTSLILWRRRHLYRHAWKAPGPFAWPIIGNAFTIVGNTYRILRAWFGSELFYLTGDPKVLEIFNKNQRKFITKHSFYKTTVDTLLGEGLFTASDPVWKVHRKLIAPTFNPKMLEEFVQIHSEQANILNKRLLNYTGKGEIDIFSVVSRCNLDIICEAIMGVNINAQTVGHEFTNWTHEIMDIAYMRAFNIQIHPDIIFNNLPVGKKFNDLCMKMKKFTINVIKEKKAKFEKNLVEKSSNEQESGRKAFLEHLLKVNYENGNLLTDQDLLDETLTFIIAGSDTSATTTCFLLTMLGMHKDIQEKLYQEVLKVLGPDKKVECEDLSNLQYLEMVIKETMRLFSVPMTMRTVSEDIDLGKFIIPKGASILFAIWKTHTNPEYWPDPYKFDPDRFLPGEAAKRHPLAYIPFFFGSRNCVAARFGMMVIKTMIATVIRKYKISASYKKVEDIKLKTNVMVMPTDGFKVSLELRT